MFCDYVEGAQPVCPLGQALWGGGAHPGSASGSCPDHLLCYLPCSAQQANSWLAVPGSSFAGQAYCQVGQRERGGCRGVRLLVGGVAAWAVAENPVAPGCSGPTARWGSGDTRLLQLGVCWRSVGCSG